MNLIRFDQSTSSLDEAEHITMFLMEMSVYRKEWQLALPDAFQQILFSVTLLLDTCVSLLIRPRLLAYVIDVREFKFYSLYNYLMHDFIHYSCFVFLKSPATCRIFCLTNSIFSS